MRLRLFTSSVVFVLLAAFSMKVAAQASGFLVVSSETNSVLRFDEVTGQYLGEFITPGLGGLSYPVYVTAGPDGYVYVSSYLTNEVKRYDLTGAYVDTFVTAGSGGLAGPLGLTFDGDGNLLVNNYSSFGGILRYQRATGAFMGVLVPPGQGATAEVHRGPDRHIYLGTYDLNRHDSATGALIDTFANWPGPGPISSFTFGPDGDVFVAVHNTFGVGIIRSPATGGVFSVFIAGGTNGLNRPGAVRIGPDGNLYASNADSSIVRYDRVTGAFIDTFIPADTSRLFGAAGFYFLSSAQQAGYSAVVGAPINADGSSVFNAMRGVVPVKFTLMLDGSATCELPPATIALSRTAGGTIGSINEADYVQSSDSGSNFRVSNCQYVYNLAAKTLGPGTYLVTASIGGVVVGDGTFSLK